VVSVVDVFASSALQHAESPTLLQLRLEAFLVDSKESIGKVSDILVEAAELAGVAKVNLILEEFFEMVGVDLSGERTGHDIVDVVDVV
jgi:hypothetical protein